MFTLLLASSSSWAVGSENLPLDHWAYELIRDLQVKGYFSRLHRDTRPFRREDIAQELRGMDSPSRPDRWLVEKLKQEFTPELDRREARLRAEVVPSYHRRGSHNVLTLMGDWGLRVSPAVGVAQRLRLDVGDYRPPHLHVNPWRRDLSGVVEYAYLWADFGRLNLFFGRDRLQWGPVGRGSLLLSSNAPAFDMIKVEGRIGPVRLIVFSAILDDLNVAPDSVAHRYLSGHRVSWRPCRAVEIGLSEVVLYGGPGRNMELYYLNPLTVYYGEQHNRQKDDNVLWGADIACRLRFGLEVCGEVLVDDFQYDLETEPHEIAFQIGLNYAGPFRSLLRAEYTRVNNWVYGQNRPWNIYTHQGELIGHWLGPDADDVSLQVRHKISRSLRWMIGFEHRRKGQGREDTPRASKVPWGGGFPSGVVERMDILNISWEYFPKADIQVVVGIEHRRIANEENEAGRDSDEFRLRLDLFHRFRRIY